jgi:diaminohydroxyphosphoribosylaminopyrimidine deaminase / 5-amino-6-(5-phosphoribosylamino)uracil reductase
MADSDLLFLDATVALAERGLYSTTPNPRVGCLLVRDGRIVGRGWHVRAGGRHAEAAALAAATAPVAGATCFVSLEPCAHQGRTPPCADALIAAQVGRVVIAARDPNPKVAGDGIRRLTAAGVQVDVIERAAALELNRGFFSRFTRGRPWLRVKIAASLDGRTAMASGESRWITGNAARADVQYWRARSCAVLTGIGTLLADDPQLTVRDDCYAVDGVLRQPLRVIVDSTLRTPPTARLLRTAGTTLIATASTDAAKQQRLHEAGADLFVTAGARVDLAGLLGELARRGCNEVLVEGGPTLTGELLRQGLWDEAIVYLAPKLLGASARPFAELSLEKLADALTGRVADVATVGEDVRIRILPATRQRLDLLALVENADD